MIAWLGVGNMRMHAPVKIGDTIRVTVDVKEHSATNNPKKGMQMWLYAVKNQRQKAVMSFDYKTMFHMRGQAP